MGLPGDQPRCTTQPTDPSGALLLSGAFGALHPHKARCGGEKKASGAEGSQEKAFMQPRWILCRITVVKTAKVVCAR